MPQHAHTKLLIAATFAAVVFLGIIIGFGVWKLLRNDTHQPQQSQAADTTAPSITLDDTSELEAGTISGTITITVDVTDDVGVEKVEFYLDNEFYGVTFAPPFSIHINTAKLSASKHTLVAKAYDKAGNSASSHKITFTVAGKAVPETAKPNSDTKADHSRPSTSATPTGSIGDSGGTPGASPPAPDISKPSTPTDITLTADGAYTSMVNWTASTDNVGISSYTVYRNGSVLGTTVSPSYKDYTVVPGNTYSYSVTASDAAGNISDKSNEPSITMAETSIWMDFDQPENFGNDGTPLEVGVKFRALVDGEITGLRFYKAANDTGTHTGTLWNASGTSLAAATFSSETGSGWQQVNFATPIGITAGQTYIASYLSPQGKYGYSTNYFASRGITSQYLTALASGIDGNNGVFKAGGGFPNSSFNHTNYWVDVSFRPNISAGGPDVTLTDPTQIFSGYPGSNNTGVVNKRLPVRDRFPTLANNSTTVSNVEFRSENIAHITVDNTVLRHVKFTYTGSGGGTEMLDIEPGADNTTIESCAFDGQNGVEIAIHTISNTTVQSSNIYNVGNGIVADDNLTATDNYIHDIFTPASEGWSAKGITTADSTSTIDITHNTIFINDDQTAAIDVQGGNTDTITDVLISSNLIAGGEYAVRLGANSTTGVQFTNNKLSTRYYPKVGNVNIYYPTYLSSVAVSGNTIYETGIPADTNL